MSIKTIYKDNEITNLAKICFYRNAAKKGLTDGF